MFSRLRVVGALCATLGAALVASPADAYQVHISIAGAGQVTETTTANLVGSNCITSASTPTGTVGKDCYAGTPSGDYAWGWTVRYVATPRSGYSFVHWTSDGGTNPVICDGGNGTSTYSGTACQFATYDNLQTRAVFADTTAPAMQNLSGPSAVANGSRTFTFSAASDPTFRRFECRVVNVHDWQPCSSGQAEDPPSGTYNFDVRARDWSDNVSAVSTWAWTVDKVAPETSVSVAPSGTVASSAASFEFSSNESGSFLCQLDTGAVADPCGSPKAYSGLADGAHTFKVWARDAAGNVDPTPATRTWSVDTTAPQTTLDPSFGPSDPTTSVTAEFRFSSSEAGSSFRCRLDAEAPTDCGSPKAYSGLSVGEHTFRVAARDPSGNLDATEATRTWTVEAPSTNENNGATTTQAITTAGGPAPDGNPASSPPTTTGTGGAPSVAVTRISGPGAGVATVTRSGRFTVPGQVISCPSGCRVALVAGGPTPARTHFDLLEGKSAVKLALSKKTLAKLKRLKKVKLTIRITVTPKGSTTAIAKTVRLTLKAPKR